MYGSDEPYRITKDRLKVDLTLSDGSAVTGFVFVGKRERLVDMLNDQRQFVPVERMDGTLVMLNKGAILRAQPATGAIGPDEDHETPYEVLGVEATADLEAIRTAYRALVREFHPDRVIASGLGDSFVKMAQDRVARINKAYDQIMKQRGGDER